MNKKIRVLNYIKSRGGNSVYPSEVADELNLGLKECVDICKELLSENDIVSSETEVIDHTKCRWLDSEEYCEYSYQYCRFKHYTRCKHYEPERYYKLIYNRGA